MPAVLPSCDLFALLITESGPVEEMPELRKEEFVVFASGENVALEDGGGPAGVVEGSFMLPNKGLACLGNGLASGVDGALEDSGAANLDIAVVLQHREGGLSGRAMLVFFDEEIVRRRCTDIDNSSTTRSLCG